MWIEMLRAKLHRAVVTEADLHYEGSIGIDIALLAAAGLLPYEKVLVVNIENAERFETYIIPRSEPGSIQVNGAAARLVSVGDHLIIMAFSMHEYPPDPDYKPAVVLLDEHNRPKSL